MDKSEFMKGLLELMEENPVPASEEEVKSFVHLKDLKPGETLREKAYSNYAFPGPGKTCTVFNVFPAREETMGASICRVDFSILMKKRTSLAEITLDSRYFERVTE
jgi:hypothetical protein